MKSNIFSRGNRMEPLTVIVKGGSAIGKSRLLPILTYELMANVIDEELLEAFINCPSDHVYARMAEHLYWDGFKNQFTTLFDDFGQVREDAQGLDNEYMNIIRATNMFPYSLHMANAEDKGTKLFNSKIVIATSNRKDLDAGRLLIEPEALKRRFHFDVEMRPKEHIRKKVPIGTNSNWEY